MKDFEMAHVDKPEEIVEATKTAIFSSLILFVADMKKDMGGKGPTWETLELVLEEFSKKKVTILTQDYES